MLYLNKNEKKIYKNFDFPRKQALKVLTDDEKTKKKAFLGSLIGVGTALGVSIALGKKNEPVKDVFIKGDIKQSAKNILKYTKLDYEGLRGYAYMLLQTLGACLGSFIGGFSEDQEHESTIEKIKEAIYVFNNVAIPAGFAKIAEQILNSDSKGIKKVIPEILRKNKALKQLTIFAAMFGGFLVGTSVTNTINTKMIDPDDKKKRAIKPTDLLVHADDVIPILVSSKDSIFAKLPLDRFLPLIYVVLGSKVGEKNYYTED